MSNQEILDQIAKFEKGLSNPNIPESTKNTIKSKIEGLKGQLEKVEEKVEKKEQKLEAEEKKIQSELEDNIAKWEKGLNNPNIPASAKEAIKKKIAAAKEEVAKQKAEIKEDKKESETEKKEVKAAVKKLAEVAKKAGKVKTKRKVVPKPEIKEDEREKKSEKRQSKLKGMMSELELLINKNKYLKSKYEGKGVDLERDASRPAKPFGYRFTGKDNFDVPTKEQIKKGLKDGSVDYEGRPNRSDKGPKKQYKLAHGGDVDNENAEMVLSKAKELEHHADELKNVVKPNSKVEAWEVAKMERAATDASDVTHYEDGKVSSSEYMADGGMMAKGGMTKKSYKTQGYDDKEDERLGMKHGKMAGKDLKSTHARRDDARFEERMAKGGEVDDVFFGKKSDVKFKFSPNENIKVLQYDNGKLKKLGATIFEQYAAEQNDGTYYPFYWVVGDWQNTQDGKKHPLLYSEGELINRHGNKPKKMEDGKKMADGGIVTTIDEAKKIIGDVEKSNNKQYSWYVPNVDDYEEDNYEEDYDHDQKYGTHLSDKGLIELANEIKGGMMAKGGMTKKSYKTQGYDDKEDERLAMKHGKMAGKDLKNTRARRDDARFEERMAKGGMAKGGKLSTKAKYIPKRDIEEVEIDKNGKEVEIDGADLLDGIYVKKASYKKKVEKKASGGQLKPKPKSKAKGTVGGGKLGNKGGNLANVVKLAKEMRKDGEKWTDAVKRASAQLKKDK